MRRMMATDAHSRTKRDTTEIMKRICISQQKNTKVRRFVQAIWLPEPIARIFDGYAVLSGRQSSATAV